MVKMQKLNSETYLVEIRCTNSFQVSRNKLQHQFFACPIVKSIFYVKLISQYKWSTRKWSFQCREDRCSTITVLKKYLEKSIFCILYITPNMTQPWWFYKWPHPKWVYSNIVNIGGGTRAASFWLIFLAQFGINVLWNCSRGATKNLTCFTYCKKCMKSLWHFFP